MREMIVTAKEVLSKGAGRKPILVLVSEEERRVIKSKSAMVGHSLSSYLRSLGMGYSPPSRVDNDKVRELMSVNADLARLGNLLKLWLSDDEKARGFSREQIQSLLDVLMDTAKTLRQKSRKILKD